MNNNIATLFDEFIDYKRKLENNRLETQKAYRHDLVMRLLPFLKERSITDISQLTARDIEDFLIYVISDSQTGSPSNRNRKLATIKSFLNFLTSRGIMFDEAIKKIKSLPKKSKPISYLSDEEKELLLNAVEKKGTPFYKTRDSAILKLFLSTGIRVSELVNLKIQDIEFHSKGVSYIYVNRKGGYEQSIPVNNKCVFAIRTYLAKRKQIESVPYLFLSKNNQKLDTNSVYSLVKHYLNEAGIHKRKWGPHILRHTVGVSLRRQGIDIATIQNLLGHKKLETTAIYLNVEPQDLEKAVQLL